MRLRLIPTNPQVRLSAGQLLAMRHAGGTRIVCQRGMVWLTQTGQHADLYLRPGQAHTVSGTGLCLLEGMDEQANEFLLELPPTLASRTLPLLGWALRHLANASHRWLSLPGKLAQKSQRAGIGMA